jgi:hypothetical protein
VIFGEEVKATLRTAHIPMPGGNRKQVVTGGMAAFV